MYLVKTKTDQSYILCSALLAIDMSIYCQVKILLCSNVELCNAALLCKKYRFTTN